MEQEKDCDLVICTDNFLSEEEMAEAFKDFNYFEGLKEGIEDIIAYQEGRPNNCRVMVAESTNIPFQYCEGDDITKAREGLKLTPHSFASVLGVSPETVEQWERGEVTPNGTASNLLYLLTSDPSLVEKLMPI